jgi:hypothetical protein
LQLVLLRWERTFLLANPSPKGAFLALANLT